MDWLWKNKWVQAFLVALVLFGICAVAGLNFHASIGANGFDAGISRTETRK